MKINKNTLKPPVTRWKAWLHNGKRYNSIVVFASKKIKNERFDSHNWAPLLEYGFNQYVDPIGFPTGSSNESVKAEIKFSRQFNGRVQDSWLGHIQGIRVRP